MGASTNTDDPSKTRMLSTFARVLRDVYGRLSYGVKQRINENLEAFTMYTSESSCELLLSCKES